MATYFSLEDIDACSLSHFKAYTNIFNQSRCGGMFPLHRIAVEQLVSSERYRATIPLLIRQFSLSPDLAQMPANWGARYPSRRNHPTRPRVRLDAIGRPSPSSSNLLLALGAPLAIVENSGKNSAAQLPGKGDTSSRVDCTRSRAVRFDSVIKLVLVPARSDLGERTKDLWWQEEDYFQFR